MQKLVTPKLFYIFLVGLFMTQIYPFYLWQESTLLTTLAMGKIIIALVFLHIVLFEKYLFQSIQVEKKIVLYLICTYLAGQTLSIFCANDILLFIKIYHNTLLSAAIFILSIIFVKSNEKSFHIATYFTLISGILFVLTEILFRISFEFLFPIFRQFAQKEIIDAYVFNMDRGKYALAQSAEMFLPFFLYEVVSNNKAKNKVFFGIISTLLLFLSILSNFRTRILIFVFGAISFGIINIFKKPIKILHKNLQDKTAFVLLSSTIVIITSYLAISVSNQSNSFNIVDRLMLQDKYQDSGTIETRLIQYQKSIDLFVSSPILGVGLGNYANSVNINNQIPQLIDEHEKAFIISSTSRPHNIFFQLLGETGLLGLIPYILLILYFLINDLRTIKGKITIDIAYMISSWSLFIYSMLNPADTVFITGWFWFFRGILEGRNNVK